MNDEELRLLEGTNGESQDTNGDSLEQASLESIVSPVDSTAISDNNIESDDPDPLELRKLALSYDYLMYKINDYISNLTEITYRSIQTKQGLINEEYFDKQLQLSSQFEQIDQMLTTCNQLELEFLKLDQLELFISEFKQRLGKLEQEFQAIG
ncbi:uncharacterized protein SPAPADRAFT_145674 [Spathaspora passalidarum NRRL Y-27907]|uniref:Biogenesis of lysosome-related organelles complex 1 subunit CNL1 n=1 Tax=Spathaspora passalidarum (strain NRRL Y-27907 / 11-Y1) TaxID=619300 RepID=G3AFH6_SPAPN|nr:uncharacterized protein SPAPADRAFT_145674 [Spathaspora passalidarum NRRL Y-27907]EGW34965.1 hypothetical protein SPAPADRAFT_145674 [Spathaspora passalidarum NRRL Y-27907]